jgi:hypothetical protein
VARWEELTRDELSVLGLLNSGRSPSEIASMMQMPAHRVRECLAEIKRKHNLPDLPDEG